MHYKNNYPTTEWKISNFFRKIKQVNSVEFCTLFWKNTECCTDHTWSARLSGCHSGSDSNCWLLEYLWEAMHGRLFHSAFTWNIWQITSKCNGILLITLMTEFMMSSNLFWEVIHWWSCEVGKIIHQSTLNSGLFSFNICTKHWFTVDEWEWW